MPFPVTRLGRSAGLKKAALPEAWSSRSVRGKAFSPVYCMYWCDMHGGHDGGGQRYRGLRQSLCDFMPRTHVVSALLVRYCYCCHRTTTTTTTAAAATAVILTYYNYYCYCLLLLLTRWCLQSVLLGLPTRGCTICQCLVGSSASGRVDSRALN